jgi:hypothetical protein
MAKAPSFQFYPSDYIRDTRALSPLARGVWMDMLCFMWYAPERGILTGTKSDFQRQLSCTGDEFEVAINEIITKKVADVTLGNGECNAIVTVINRRMYKQEKERESTRLRVKRFRNADVKRECNEESNADVTGLSSTSSSKEKEKKKKVLTDEEWLQSLEANPIYEGIEVRVLYGKMLVWCETRGKKPTRRRFVAWLNREERPLQGQKKTSW